MLSAAKRVHMARNAPSRTLAPNLTLVLRGLGRLQHPSGPVFFVRDRQPQPKEIVLAQWKRTLFLRDEGLEARGWLIEVMNCVESIGEQEFQLDDVYSFESTLSQLYPNNRHVKQKIRQQLQVLRDRGYLDFMGRGYYRLRSPA